jgi:hypothetical protein
MRSAQQMMQMCFDKQQEQLEMGRRIRDHQHHHDITSTSMLGGTLTRTVQEETSTTRRRLN